VIADPGPEGDGDGDGDGGGGGETRRSGYAAGQCSPTWCSGSLPGPDGRFLIRLRTQIAKMLRGAKVPMMNKSAVLKCIVPDDPSVP